MINNFSDILGYYDTSRAMPEGGPLEAVSLAEILSEEEPLAARWPVRNREERTEIGSQKRAIIHERDGKMCRYCATTDRLLVVDHIVPRSAFLAEDLRIADRSDNLHSACWGCNESRSNYETSFQKRLGVTAACFYCTHPEYLAGDNEPLQLPYPVNILAFCGRCGVSTVPSLDWIL